MHVCLVIVANTPPDFLAMGNLVRQQVQSMSLSGGVASHTGAMYPGV